MFKYCYDDSRPHNTMFLLDVMPKQDGILLVTMSPLLNDIWIHLHWSTNVWTSSYVVISVIIIHTT